MTYLKIIKDFSKFGHTFAHAIEMATQKYLKRYLDIGEAVGIGMLCEIFYSNKGKM